MIKSQITMKTGPVVKICLICLVVLAVAFLALKLTIWKASPDSYLKELKKDKQVTSGARIDQSERSGKNHKQTQGVHSGNKRSGFEAVPVEARRVEKGDIEIFLRNNCTLEAEKQVDVVAKTSGIVLNILAEEGDYVKSGEPLAKLDDKEELLALREAKLKKENAERVYKNSLNNFKENIISQEEFEDKKFQFEIASVELERKQLEYEYTTIESPIEGVIVERNIEEGFNIEKEQTVFKIADFDPILARVYIPEKDIHRVVEGQTARIISEFMPEIKFTGKVKIVSPVVDPESGTVKTTIEMKNMMGGVLRAGMFVTVFTIVDHHKDALLIPKKSLILEADEDEVFIARDYIIVSVGSGRAERLSIDDRVVCEGITLEGGSRGGAVSVARGKVVDISRSYEDERLYNITIEAADDLRKDAGNIFEKISFYNSRDSLVLQVENIGFGVVTRAYRRKVNLGFKEGDRVEVLTGLEEGERVITVGQDDVGHGAEVTIINKE